MTPRIEFDDGFVLTADSKNWIIGIPDTRERDGEVEEYLSKPTYYSKLGSALWGLAERRLRSTEAKTLVELLNRSEELRQEITEAVNE